jgi:hypothetical protein
MLPKRNLQTSLKRRRSGNPMRGFDQLPAELRRWLCGARLPWSPKSAARLWARALARTGGDTVQALAILDRAEARALARDAGKLWGPDHPAAAITVAGLREHSRQQA